ncbi:DUF4240 domain-containing protein [Kitasatospora sp. NPDC048540]|uniref:DUF4240 domain-containing protein n=1 Tax=unclassified Kitasatospora TaxID=2633591 RepID=UPI000539C123|nr:DUF4240 domain-containing protein [Kitasatospora sp. MBT63]
MDKAEFWQLIAVARGGVLDPSDGEAVAERAAGLLAARPRAEILAAQQVFWDLMAESYRTPLWAAAYLLNGGCSDDGFDYFRGWLITQGREAFECAVERPDTLAGLPAVRAAVAGSAELECEEALGIAWDAHLAATGSELPDDAFTITYPTPGGGDGDGGGFWDFDDDAEMAARLPRLTALLAE